MRERDRGIEREKEKDIGIKIEKERDFTRASYYYTRYKTSAIVFIVADFGGSLFDLLPSASVSI